MKSGKKNEDVKPRLSRRDFLRGSVLLGGAAAVGAGGVMSGCGRGTPATPADDAAVAFDFVNLYRHVGDVETGSQSLHDFALDGEDNLYVADEKGVAVFASDGRRIRSWTTGEPVRCITVAADGSVWVGSGGNVLHFSADGRQLGRFAAKATDSGRKAAPLLIAIAVREADVVVYDATRFRLLRFAVDGDFIGEVGGRLTIPSPYMSICFDAAGLLHITHTGGKPHRIERYHLDGRLAGSWGKAGSRPGRFGGCCNPVGLFVTKDGRTITAEKGFGRVTVFDRAGKPISLVGPKMINKASRKIRVAEDSTGRILVSDPAEKRIRIFRKFVVGSS